MNFIYTLLFAEVESFYLSRQCKLSCQPRTNDYFNGYFVTEWKLRWSLHQNELRRHLMAASKDYSHNMWPFSCITYTRNHNLNYLLHCHFWSSLYCIQPFFLPFSEWTKAAYLRTGIKPVKWSWNQLHGVGNKQVFGGWGILYIPVSIDVVYLVDLN